MKWPTVHSIDVRAELNLYKWLLGLIYTQPYTCIAKIYDHALVLFIEADGYH